MKVERFLGLMDGVLPSPSRGRETLALARVRVCEIVGRGESCRPFWRTALRTVRLVAEPFRAVGLAGGGVDVSWRWRLVE